MTSEAQHSDASVDLKVHEAETLRRKLLEINAQIAETMEWPECEATLRGIATFLRLRIARVTPPTYDLDVMREGMGEGDLEEAA